MKNALKRIAALAAVILAGSCFARAEEDPVIVRVGDITYTRSVVQSALDTDLSLFSLINGKYYTEEEREAQTEATLHRFIGNGLIESKLSEAGLNDFSPVEEETLKAAARERYESYWQEVYNRLAASGEKPSEEKVTRVMDQGGYTLDAFLAEYKMSERRSRAIGLFLPGLTISEEQVREYYEKMCLQPDRERYQDHLSAYESEILATGSESFYTPEGYRLIRQVLLEYPEEIAAPLRNDYYRLAGAIQNMSAALQRLTGAAVAAESWEDLAGPRAEYDQAAAEMESAQSAYDEKRKALAAPLVQETLDEIRTQYNDGVDFVTLIRQYSADRTQTNTGEGSGYPVHPDSEQWPENFRNAACSLQKPGDISEPVYTDAGIHILYYEGDLPSGDHVLTAEEQDALNAAELYYYQSQQLEALFPEWMEDYEVETFPERLYR